jgi:hypothetical protein
MTANRLIAGIEQIIFLFDPAIHYSLSGFPT